MTRSVIPRLSLAFALAALLPAGAQTRPQAWHPHALWIAAPPAASAPAAPAPLPLFRRAFQLRIKPVKATLNISGLGQYEARINGVPVTDSGLNPGWTDYRKTVLYNTWDVTALLHAGDNALGVLLGNGMYNVEKTPGRYTKFEGSFGRPRLLAELTLTYPAGRTEVIATDNSWRTSPGPITFSSIYGGEDFDARLEPIGWDTSSFDDHLWSPVTVLNPTPAGLLTFDTLPPIRLFDRFQPVAITHPQPGITVYDLGENFAGWPDLEVTGPQGATLTLIAGELLDPHGLVTQRSANASPHNATLFRYTLAGTPQPEHWHPRFSYYGFRFVQVESSSTSTVIQHLDGRFLHLAVTVDGTFTSSDPLLTHIHALILRAMLSNTMSILTDCPHREKLGWIEQTHLAAASLMDNFGLAAVYARLSANMEDAQLPNGLVPDIAPEYVTFPGDFRDTPEWGSAVILAPWAAFQQYGDAAPLALHYASMQRYAAYLHGISAKNPQHLLAYGLGDWYDIGPRPPGRSQLTSAGITASAVYFQALNALARIATLLHHADDAARYTQETAELKLAFNQRFFHAGLNLYDNGSQTANAMPLALGLVPDGHQDQVLANLVADIRAHRNHVTSGEVGFHYLVRALTENDRSDVLYDMLSRSDNPSYGDQLAHGATALTEAWDANPTSSQNHFMLGQAEEWFYRGLAGIDLDMSRGEDEKIRIQPNPVGKVQSASATYKASLGLISSGWTRNGDSLTLDVTIPPGATANILFPSAFRAGIQRDGKPLIPGRGVLRTNLNDTTPHAYLSAGTYRFDLLRK